MATVGNACHVLVWLKLSSNPNLERRAVWQCTKGRIVRAIAIIEIKLSSASTLGRRLRVDIRYWIVMHEMDIKKFVISCLFSERLAELTAGQISSKML